MADCEFCGSGVDVEAQDMGEGRVMLLCAECRANIAAGEKRDRETMADNEQDIDGRATCPHEDAAMWNPYNHVVQCHRCGEVFVPGSAATPADAIMGFAAWLTSRPERVGPFSRFDDAALMVELVKHFCDFNGWPDVGPNFPHTFRMPPDGGLNPQADANKG